MHGGETWYTCVFQCFHDKHWQKIALGTFPNNYFFTFQTCTPYNAWRWNLVRMCISAFPWQPCTKKPPQALFPITTSLLKFANHAIHESETWYTCVFQHFHEQKRPQVLLTNNDFFTSQTCKPWNALRWNFAGVCISVLPWQPSIKTDLGHPSLFTSQTCKLYSARRWHSECMCIPWTKNGLRHFSYDYFFTS